ncbi:MAG: sigma-54-dependent Fis family transcriptional regulator [Polyangiaceae bacterium]|nr:sigma-54-dependent Fis family transcriptional regulator [Polyangiaceae bacterium]
MRRLDALVQRVADKDVTLTLVGESGSGKEVLARRIHDLSPRRRGPFVPINCAAIPDALFESELFGHERGAYTGATDRALGKIEAADGGTLFLDEIGEMPLHAQAKLLRFLENRRFMRLGGSTKLQVDVRLVCATLRELGDEVEAGRFRADLYYRIQGLPIRVPPLRDRARDLVPLVTQFVAQLSAKHGVAPPRLGRQVLAALRAYAWPGNVRELRNTIELLCLLRSGRSARPEDLPAPLRAALAPGSATPAAGARLTLELDRSLDEHVDRILRAVLELEGGHQTRAAARLGVSVRTLQRRLGAVRSGARRPAARPPRRGA